MKIDLTREQEKIVEDELKSGQFRSAEEVIDEALHNLRRQSKSHNHSPQNGDGQRAVQEMLEFVQQNRVRLEGISVKDLIGEGRKL